LRSGAFDGYLTVCESKRESSFEKHNKDIADAHKMWELLADGLQLTPAIDGGYQCE
jgi:hypothetical protein